MREATLRREGIEGLSADSNESRPEDDKTKSTRDARRRSPAAGDVGKALRSAYDEALREDVPDDFLNLLGKLS
ncbi:NepR family anti-sigma factor [Sphingomonas glaciei]|uniref:NepR family anti-sigma factor n=1 Tax=Sphingomonas glaciei TaxID=2938948 RepID=A0ABY5MTF7_9SPHN|nr:NepR family anti-sigma factor [Sphingomonas glaciei]UUR07795.1 NepR family anti-sigma factor [Sphingomonas glaciei]